MDNSTYAALVAVVVLALFLPGMNIAYQQTGTTTAATDTVTVNYSDPSELAHPSGITGWSENITVTNEAGSKLTESEDYRYYAANGTIVWLDSSNTQSGETATADYAYILPRPATQHTNELLGNIAPVLGFALLLAGAGGLYRLLDRGGF